MLFGLYLGLRVSEIAAARWDRFGSDLEWYTVLGKGDLVAELPVHPALRSELVATRKHRMSNRWMYPGSVSDRWVFPGSRSRDHVTPNTAHGWIVGVADQAGIGHITPHQLRHTCLTFINDATGDLRATQVMARHRSIESTTIYTRVTNERLQTVVGALDVLE